jgi:hypothetical protein
MIKKAKYLYDYLIEVTFEDGTERVIDLENLFSTNPYSGFRDFLPLDKFKKFHIDEEIGTLCWGDNELDINPWNIYEGKYDAQIEYA